MSDFCAAKKKKEKIVRLRLASFKKAEDDGKNGETFIKCGKISVRVTQKIQRGIIKIN